MDLEVLTASYNMVSPVSTSSRTIVKDLMTPLCVTGGGRPHSRYSDLGPVALAVVTVGLDDGAIG